MQAEILMHRTFTHWKNLDMESKILEEMNLLMALKQQIRDVISRWKSQSIR